MAPGGKEEDSAGLGLGHDGTREGHAERRGGLMEGGLLCRKAAGARSCPSSRSPPNTG